jgi:hypothetical protein
MIIIDPSQNAVTIRINSLFTVENEPQFGASESDVFGDSSKYAMCEIHMYAMYGTFNFDEGFNCALNSN